MSVSGTRLRVRPRHLVQEYPIYYYFTATVQAIARLAATRMRASGADESSNANVTRQ
jgi:hypothetical protein